MSTQFRSQGCIFRALLSISLLTLLAQHANAQDNTDLSSPSLKEMPKYKNVVRYNLTGALLFGFDRYFVVGYERVIKPNQSASINIGKASLPALISINTDDYELGGERDNTGFNVSVDYRFYLPKENKYKPVHGLYIGPYYSYNDFKRSSTWTKTSGGTSSYVGMDMQLQIHTIGFELGYQFVLWKRLALDLLMVGPGIGFYKADATFDTNLSPERREKFQEGLQQVLTQKVPGMNYVFGDKSFSADGSLNTTAFGYRYLIQIGYVF